MVQVGWQGEVRDGKPFVEMLGHNCYYLPPDESIRNGGFGRANGASLAELLFEFFKLYAHDFDWEHNVVSIRCGQCVSL